MDQLPPKFGVFVHKGSKDLGQFLPGGTWYDTRPPAEKEANSLTFQLTDKQREKGFSYSVRPIAQGYRPRWRPAIKSV
jgi:hypothetical protein